MADFDPNEYEEVTDPDVLADFKTRQAGASPTAAPTAAAPAAAGVAAPAAAAIADDMEEETDPNVLADINAERGSSFGTKPVEPKPAEVPGGLAVAAKSEAEDRYRHTPEISERVAAANAERAHSVITPAAPAEFEDELPAAPMRLPQKRFGQTWGETASQVAQASVPDDPEDIARLKRGNDIDKDLMKRMVDNKLFGAATSAVNIAEDKRIYRENGVWNTPTMLKDSDHWAVNAVQGPAMLLGQALGKRDTSEHFEQSAETTRKMLDDFQKEWGLTDEQVQQHWMNFNNRFRKWEDDEVLRVGSHGGLELNRQGIGVLDTEAATKKINDSTASPAAKKYALMQLRDVQHEAANNMLTAYSAAAAADGRTDFDDYVKNGQAAGKELPEIIKGYEQDVVAKQPGWKKTLRAASNKLMYEGFGSMASQAMGVAGMLGSEKAADAAMEYQEGMDAINKGNMDLGAVGTVLSTAPSALAAMIPGTLAAKGVMGLGKAGLIAGKTAQTAAGIASKLGAFGTAGLQSAAGTYTQELQENLDKGMSREEAEKDAKIKGGRAGLTTAIITSMFGATGTEALAGTKAADATLRDIMKMYGGQGLKTAVKSPEFREMGKRFLMNTIGEAPEESLDQLATTFATADPDTNLADAWHSAGQAAIAAIGTSAVANVGKEGFTKSHAATLAGQAADAAPEASQAAMAEIIQENQQNQAAAEAARNVTPPAATAQGEGFGAPPVETPIPQTADQMPLNSSVVSGPQTYTRGQDGWVNKAGEAVDVETVDQAIQAQMGPPAAAPAAAPPVELQPGVEIKEGNRTYTRNADGTWRFGRNQVKSAVTNARLEEQAQQQAAAAAAVAPQVAETAPQVAETAPQVAETAPQVAETALPVAETGMPPKVGEEPDLSQPPEAAPAVDSLETFGGKFERGPDGQWRGEDGNPAGPADQSLLNKQAAQQAEAMGPQAAPAAAAPAPGQTITSDLGTFTRDEQNLWRDKEGNLAPAETQFELDRTQRNAPAPEVAAPELAALAAGGPEAVAAPPAPAAGAPAAAPAGTPAAAPVGGPAAAAATAAPPAAVPPVETAAPAPTRQGVVHVPRLKNHKDAGVQAALARLTARGADITFAQDRSAAAAQMGKGESDVMRRKTTPLAKAYLKADGTPGVILFPKAMDLKPEALERLLTHELIHLEQYSFEGTEVGGQLAAEAEGTFDPNSPNFDPEFDRLMRKEYPSWDKIPPRSKLREGTRAAVEALESGRTSHFKPGFFSYLKSFLAHVEKIFMGDKAVSQYINHLQTRLNEQEAAAKGVETTPETDATQEGFQQQDGLPEHPGIDESGPSPEAVGGDRNAPSGEIPQAAGQGQTQAQVEGAPEPTAAGAATPEPGAAGAATPPPAGGAPVGGRPQTEAGVPEEIALNHAYMRRRLRDLDLPDYLSRRGETNQEMVDLGIAALNKNRNAAIELADDIIKEQRPVVNSRESGTLLVGQALAAIKHAEAIKNYTRARRSGSETEIAEAEQKLMEARDAEEHILIAGAVAGTEAGKLFQQRRVKIDQEYSLLGMKTAYNQYVNRKGQAMTASEEAKVDDLYQEVNRPRSTHDLFEDADDLKKHGTAEEAQQAMDLAHVVASVGADVKQAKAKNAPPKLAPELRKKVKKAIGDRAAAIRERIRQEADAVRARREAEGKPETPADVVAEEDAMNEKISKQQMKDAVWLGADYIANGVTKLSTFTKKLVDDMGEGMRNHAEKIFKKSQGLYHETTESIQGENAPSPQEIMEGVAGPEDIDKKLVFDLLRAHIIEGTEGRQAVTATHEDLQTIDPDITREEVAQMITEYGKPKYPSGEPVAKELRWIKRAETAVKGIEDLDKAINALKKGEKNLGGGGFPKRTGFQREVPEGEADAKAAEKAAELRRLTKERSDKIQELEQLMRDADMAVPSDERKLKSTVETRRKRWQNEIDELQEAIDKNEALKTKEGKPIAMDQEDIDLRKRLQDKRAEYNEHFGPEAKEKTPEQKIAALEKSLDRQIADEERMLREKIHTRPKGESVTSPRIEEQRAELADLRAQRRALREAANPKKTKLQQAKDAVQKQIDALSKEMLTGEREVREGKKTEEQVMDEHLQGLLDVRDALRDQVTEMRKAMPETPQKEKARQQRELEAAERQLNKLEDKMARGDYSVEKRGQRRSVSPETQAVRDQIKDINKSLAKARKEEAKIGRNPEEKQLEKDKKATRKAIERLQKEIDTGERTTRETRTMNTDAELDALKDVKAKLQQEVDSRRKALPKTPAQERVIEERALKKAEETLKNINAKLASGDLSTKPKKETVASRSAAVQSVRKEIANANKELATRRREEALSKRDLEQEKVDRYVKNLNARRDEYNRRRAAGEFKGKPKAEPLQHPLARQARTEMNVAKQKFKDAAIKDAHAKRGVATKTGLFLYDLVNQFSKTLLTIFDAGGIGHQGLAQFFSNPIKTAKEMPKHLAFRDATVQQVIEQMEADPDWDLMREHGLGLTGQGEDLGRAQQEGTWESSIAKKFGIIKKGEAGFSLFLNGIRMAAAKPLIEALRAQPGGMTKENLQMAMKYVNQKTGRGGLGQYDAAIPLLSLLAFAPRYAISQIQYDLGLFKDAYLATKHKITGEGDPSTQALRKLILKDRAKVLGGQAIWHALFAGGTSLARNLLGEEDKEEDQKLNFHWNPLDEKFGQVSGGGLNVDISGGRLRMLGLAARIMAGKKINKRGEEVDIRGEDRDYNQSMANELGRFVRGKASPGARIALDYLNEKTAKGELPNWEDVVLNNYLPITPNEMISTIMKAGWDVGRQGKGAIATLGNFTGFNSSLDKSEDAEYDPTLIRWLGEHVFGADPERYAPAGSGGGGGGSKSSY